MTEGLLERCERLAAENAKLAREKAALTATVAELQAAMHAVCRERAA